MYKSRNAREGHYFGKIGGHHIRLHGGPWNLRNIGKQDGCILKMNKRKPPKNA